MAQLCYLAACLCLPASLVSWLWASLLMMLAPQLGILTCPLFLSLLLPQNILIFLLLVVLTLECSHQSGQNSKAGPWSWGACTHRSCSTASPGGLCEIGNYKTAEKLPPSTVLCIRACQQLCYAGCSEDVVSNQKFKVSNYKEIMFID